MSEFLTPPEIAGVCHEVNRAYCNAIGETGQPPWADAPEWQRVSAELGVLARLLDPTLTPEKMHELWLAEKKADGWTYGDRKDPDTKKHPCIRPFHHLPLQQQMKDHLFGAVVEALRPFAMPVKRHQLPERSTDSPT